MQLHPQKLIRSCMAGRVSFFNDFFYIGIVKNKASAIIVFVC